jgi:hypothetical protein
MDAKTLRGLLAKKNVVSVGKGRKRVGGKDTGRNCIVIGVTKKVPPANLTAQNIIPKIVGSGEETDVVELGEIKLL